MNIGNLDASLGHIPSAKFTDNSEISAGVQIVSNMKISVLLIMVSGVLVSKYRYIIRRVSI
jgi:hypothetical protein